MGKIIKSLVILSILFGCIGIVFAVAFLFAEYVDAVTAAIVGLTAGAVSLINIGESRWMDRFLCS